MPELPEVETLRCGLESRAVGRCITDVVITNTKVLKGQSATVFQERTVGRSILQANRRGKYLLLPLATKPNDNNSSLSLCIHLKMRGQLLLEDRAVPLSPYHCVTLRLDDDLEVRFHDMWTWGEIRSLTTEELAGVKALQQMGDEPLAPDWDVRLFAQSLARKRAAIKTVLLDQSVIAGVGNIYADESLYVSGILPTRLAASLTTEEIDRLAEAIRTVLSAAVVGGGTISDNYVDVDGVAGRYVPKVYGQAGVACPKCGEPLTRIRLGGRGTVYCTKCQT